MIFRKFVIVVTLALICLVANTAHADNHGWWVDIDSIYSNICGLDNRAGIKSDNSPIVARQGNDHSLGFNIGYDSKHWGIRLHINSLLTKSALKGQASEIVMFGHSFEGLSDNLGISNIDYTVGTQMTLWKTNADFAWKISKKLALTAGLVLGNYASGNFESLTTRYPTQILDPNRVLRLKLSGEVEGTFIGPTFGFEYHASSKYLDFSLLASQAISHLGGEHEYTWSAFNNTDAPAHSQLISIPEGTFGLTHKYSRILPLSELRSNLEFKLSPHLHVGALGGLIYFPNLPSKDSLIAKGVSWSIPSAIWHKESRSVAIMQAGIFLKILI